MTRRLTSLLMFAATIFALAFFVPGTVFGQEQDGWTIENFTADITVHEDASLTVTETISVDFFEQKHGIFRYIPVVYTDDFGNSVRIDLSVEAVLQDGKPAIIDVSRQRRDKFIRIGDPDEEITGVHEYKITYAVDRALLFLDDHDELYWNVTGIDWPTDIKTVSANITLPDGAKITAAECFTGPFASVQQECDSEVNGPTITVRADDFLTVAVGFSKGAVAAPTVLKRAGWFIKDNWPAVFPLFIGLAAFLIWRRLGKDPETGTVVAEYEPPEGMKAVYAGFLLKDKMTSQSIAAMIIQLAVDGYIEIHVEGEGRKKTTTLVKKKPADSRLDDAHTQLFSLLFKKEEKRTLAELKNSIPSGDVHMLKRKIKNEIKSAGYYTGTSFWLKTLMILIGVIFMYIAVFFGFLFGLFAGITFFASALATVFFGVFMPKKTPKGVSAARRAAGFKLFMHTAERYRSEWKERQNIFFDYLPYAIAFNDVKQWAKAFRGLEVDEPDWYSGVSAFNSMSVADDIGDFSQSFVQRSSSSPSSGVSGGGFSGGGFGGGGGGSW